jgi:hypothetical protein
MEHPTQARDVGFPPNGSRELACHTSPTQNSIPPKRNRISTHRLPRIRHIQVQHQSTARWCVGHDLTTTNESATYPHTDNESAKKPTSDILIVINPLCSSLNKNAARALQSSVYQIHISIVQLKETNGEGDTPYPHPSDQKTRTRPRVDWVLAVPHGRCARRCLLVTLRGPALRLLLPETLPSTPNPALNLDQSMKKTTHMNQLIPLPFQQVLHRNPCSLRHHPRNIVRRHPIMKHRQRRLLIPIRLVSLRGKLALQLGNGRELQARGELELALSLCYVQLVLGFFQSTLDVFDLVQPSFLYTEPESVPNPF